MYTMSTWFAIKTGYDRPPTMSVVEREAKGSSSRGRHGRRKLVKLVNAHLLILVPLVA
jgi:hypothetical protein